MNDKLDDFALNLRAHAASKAIVVWYYAACRACTAKWFAPFKPLRCPRCGEIDPLVVRQNPPWLPLPRNEPVNLAVSLTNWNEPGPVRQFCLPNGNLCAHHDAAMSSDIGKEALQ